MENVTQSFSAALDPPFYDFLITITLGSIHLNMPPELPQAAREEDTPRIFQQRDRKETSEANKMPESICGSESENFDPTSQKADTPSSEQDGYLPIDQEKLAPEDTVEEEEGEVIKSCPQSGIPECDRGAPCIRRRERIRPDENAIPSSIAAPYIYQLAD